MKEKRVLLSIIVSTLIICTTVIFQDEVHDFFMPGPISKGKIKRQVLERLEEVHSGNHQVLDAVTSLGKIEIEEIEYKDDQNTISVRYLVKWKNGYHTGSGLSFRMNEEGNYECDTFITHLNTNFYMTLEK